MRRHFVQFSVVLLLAVSLAGCSEPLERKQKVSSFQFTDQNGHPFGTEQLDGSIWIADFVFTNCNTVCPTMTIEMAELQQQLEKKSLDVELVSFSVDPELDTPDVLKKYIKQFTDDESNWHLLTGYSQEDIESFAREDFQSIVLKHDASSQVLHGTNFYLIDQEGYVINEYNFIEEAYMEDLLKDIEKLKR